MPISIDITPVSDALHVYGDPDSSAAYSLSGHVAISITSPYSIFERRRTTRILLQSVALTFEGQSEMITPSIAYAAVRLCSITKELVSEEPVELSNEGHEDSNEPCVWNIVFNITIPGWLPETSLFGIDDIGTRYKLFATAQFVDLADSQSTAWSFNSLCSLFYPRTRSLDAEKAILVRRFARPPADEFSPLPSVTYLVNSPGSSRSSSDKPHIPHEVLSKIQVLASVPEYVDVADWSVPLTLRLRTKDLPESDCKRLQLTAFSVDVIQREKCRHRIAPEYLARFPLPSRSAQPPNQPLRDPHPISSVYDIGLYVPSSSTDSSSRSFSLLPKEETGQYALGGDNYVFARDAVTVENPTWYTLETTIPFVQCSPMKDRSVEWAGAPKLRPTATSPLFGVRHEVAISLTCTYDMPDGQEPATERLAFFVPVQFAREPPALPARSLTPPPSHPAVAEMATTIPALPLLVPYAKNLPAYSQLYDRNGDRKIDYSVPLPLYTPRASEPSPCSATSPDGDVELPNYEQKSFEPPRDALTPSLHMIS